MISRLLCSFLMRAAFRLILWAARFDAPYSWKLIRVFVDEVKANEVKASVAFAYNADQ